MTPAAFKRTLNYPVPPRAVSPPLQSLWWAKKGDWDKAHRVIMDEHGRDAAWVRAYLHRVEADDGNARYWYGQAKRGFPKSSLDDEWDEIVAYLTS
jgi:hypothetical protein